MPTSMPGAVDTSLTDPTSSNKLADAIPKHSLQHATVNDAMKAVSRIVVGPEKLNFLDDRIGAVGDDSTDNATAQANAKALMPASGGKLLIPPGIFRSSSTWNWDDTRGVVLEGAAGRTAGAPALSVLKYTGGGAGVSLSARSTYGFRLRDIQLQNSNSAWTGFGVDLSHSGAGTDSGFWEIDNVTLTGLAGTTAGSWINIANSIDGTISRCNFSLRGRAITNNSAYANSITVAKCTFNNSTSRPILIGGGCEAWLVENCTFEPLASGASGAIYFLGASANRDITILSCWFGDTADANYWLSVDNIVLGLYLIGNHPGTGKLVSFSVACDTIIILGVYGTAQVSLGGAAHNNVWVIGPSDGPSKFRPGQLNGAAFTLYNANYGLGMCAADAVLFGATGGGAGVGIGQDSATGTLSARVRTNDADIADGSTALLLRRNVGGTLTLQPVTMGAADSGGAGFKALRVPN